jgi:hypothetical protein
VDGIEPLAPQGPRLQRGDGASLSLLALPVFRRRRTDDRGRIAPHLVLSVRPPLSVVRRLDWRKAESTIPTPQAVPRAFQAAPIARSVSLPYWRPPSPFWGYGAARRAAAREASEGWRTVEVSIPARERATSFRSWLPGRRQTVHKTLSHWLSRGESNSHASRFGSGCSSIELRDIDNLMRGPPSPFRVTARQPSFAPRQGSSGLPSRSSRSERRLIGAQGIEPCRLR